jgi:uncharacterized RDD family membrane protein YckC
MNRPSALSKPLALTSLLGYYAGFFGRVTAMLIDSIIVSVTFISITWFVSVTITMLQLRSFLGYSIHMIPNSADIIETIFGPTVGGILTLGYIIFYYVFFWSIRGQTPGKYLLGVRIVTTQGNRVTPLKCLVRFLAMFISAVPFGLGFLWVIFDDRRQGWHDKIAGTLVIYTWAAHPDERFLAREIHGLDQDEPGSASSQT